MASHFTKDALVETSFTVRLQALLEVARSELTRPFMAVVELAAKRGRFAAEWNTVAPRSARARLPNWSLDQFRDIVKSETVTRQVLPDGSTVEVYPLDVRPRIGPYRDAALVCAGEGKFDEEAMCQLCRCLEHGLSRNREQSLAQIILAAVTQAPDPIEITDHEARVLFVNDSWQRFFGHSRDEVVGETVANLIRDSVEQPHDDAFYQFTLAALAGGAPWVGALGSRTRMGERVFNEVNVGPFNADLQGFRGNIALRRDLSHRAGRDAALAAAHREFRAVLTALPDGVAVLRDGEVYFANPAFLSMVESTLGKVIGCQYVDFIHEDDRHRFNGELQHKVTRVRMLRPDGHTRFAEISAAGAVSFEGKPAMIVISRDTTDDRIAQEQLARADKLSALGSLAAGVAHEINNPLAYVILNLRQVRELLSSSGTLPELELKLIDEAIDGVQRIRGIVSELRGFSSSERPDVVEPVDVAKAASSAVNIVQNEIRHRARLIREHDEGVFVLAREGQLVQVLVNVLVNAAQAIPSGDGVDHAIAVYSKQCGAEAQITVRDSGSGIPRSALAHVFDPFYTRKPRGEGSGLGLAISKRIIDGFGGRINIDSEEGTGTTVTITLPRIATPKTPPPPAHEIQLGQATPLRVLIVDDELAIARALRRTLRGHDVHIAGDGREALALLERDASFDLIFCDLMMPGLAGPELFERACDLRPELKARFVFMTGGAFSDGSRHFIERTRPPILHKPFEPETVLQFVRVAAATQS